MGSRGSKAVAALFLAVAPTRTDDFSHHFDIISAQLRTMALSARSFSQVWLASCLLVLAHLAFGWLVAMHSKVWGEALHGWLAEWGFEIALALVEKGIVIVCGGCVVGLITILVMPLHLMRIFFGAWLQENGSAVVSVLIWACVAVVIATQLVICTRFAVLGAAIILARLDFQAWGWRNGGVWAVLTLMGLGGFTLGIYMSYLGFASGILSPI